MTVLIEFLSAFLAGAMAFTVLLQGRRLLAHWLFALGMITFAVESVFAGLAADAVAPDRLVYWQQWRQLATSFLPGTWFVFSLVYARGNARQSLAKWNWLLVAALILCPAFGVLYQGQWFTKAERERPSSDWVFSLTPAGTILNLLFLLATILILLNLERTFRASVGTMRWRIKFMVLGLGVLFAVRVYTSTQVLLFHNINLSLQALNSAALGVACLLMVRSLFRAGHFDVSVYPSQLVLHNSFTVMLAGIYLVMVGALLKVVNLFGQGLAFPLTAFLVLVSLVLLSILLLSDRVRLQTKRWISRHFQRPIHDYRTIWRAFTVITARQVEKKELCSAMVKLVSEIFQALSVTVWLVDDRDEALVFAASTSLSTSQAERLRLESRDCGEIIRALRGHPDPIDIDATKDMWAALIRRLHPDEFSEGGNRICVPMLAGGELVGLMTLGDRVGGVPFSIQDFDLLRAVGEQAAASLLNIRMSQRLYQAKQLEAFQAMSAFFVHDLKNTASTLSLMLQNLPVHYQDPKFREDALRGISKTVTHINDLIGRLSLLRQELTVQPVECDFNELVAQCLREQPDAPGIELVKELGPLPKVRVDPGQIRKVLTNLVLNAKEAVSGNGQIRVETSQRNGWIVLGVADNGCGMTPEFVQASLFRPFQTTKKQGIGIGMFHCKMIVEAHQGRIEVESQPGKGSTFRVLLPLTADSNTSQQAL